KGHRGISCFLVEAKAPGLRFVKAQVLSAPHPLGEIAFERCRVPASARLGPEGEGFKLGMATLDRLRATVGAAACGMAERALAETGVLANHPVEQLYRAIRALRIYEGTTEIQHLVIASQLLRSEGGRDA